MKLTCIWCHDPYTKDCCHNQRFFAHFGGSGTEQLGITSRWIAYEKGLRSRERIKIKENK